MRLGLKINFSFNTALVILLLLLVACQNKEEIPIDTIEINTQFQRFDQAFFGIDTNRFEQELITVKNEFPLFFKNGGTLKFWRIQRTEPLQIELYQKTEKTFGSLSAENEKLNLMLKRYYQLFGQEDTLRFYTYISRLDFGFPVLFADTVCFAALDLYLGPKSKFYQNLPAYLAYERQAKFLVRDVGEALLQPRIPRKQKSETLLDAMVHYGKLHYFLEKLNPGLSEADLLKYPPEKLAFSKEREKQMWVYFIENQLLFKSSADALRRFIEVAPFSKFRTELDVKTPGRIGQWFGYQIVKAYAENNPEQPLLELLEEMDSQKILKLSAYKP
jgi:hypothetical protein